MTRLVATAAAVDAEARALAEFLTWMPGCPADKLVTTGASAIGVRIIAGTLTPGICAFFASFEIGREILALAHQRLQKAFDLPPTDQPIASVLLDAAASLRDEDREVGLAEMMAAQVEAAAGDERQLTACEEIAKTIARGSEVGERGMERARRELFRRHAERPPVRSSWSAVSALRPIRRFVASRRRRASSSTAKAANGRDSPEDGRGRPLARGAAHGSQHIHNNTASITETKENINSDDAPAIGEPWAGSFSDLAPLLLLMRDDPGADWEAVEVSAEHAGGMMTKGAA